SPLFSASTIACLALCFTSGAQASSRSRNTSSAGRPWDFSRKRALLPGTARQERRGRSRFTTAPPSAAAAPGVLSGRVILRLSCPPPAAGASPSAKPGRAAQLSADGPGRGGAFQHRLGDYVEGEFPGLAGRGVELIAEDARERGDEGVADGLVV